jgi:hypothetical protein
MNTMTSEDVSIIVTPPSPAVPCDQPGPPRRCSIPTCCTYTSPTPLSSDTTKSVVEKPSTIVFSASLQRSPDASLPQWRRCAIGNLKWLERELIAESMIEAAAGVGDYAREQINLMTETQREINRHDLACSQEVDNSKVHFMDSFSPPSRLSVLSTHGTASVNGALEPSPSQLSELGKSEDQKSDCSGTFHKAGNEDIRALSNDETSKTVATADTLGSHLYSDLSRYPPFLYNSANSLGEQPTDGLTSTHVSPPPVSEFRRMNSEPIIKTLSTGDSNVSSLPSNTRTRAKSISTDHPSTNSWLRKPKFNLGDRTSTVVPFHKPRIVKFPMNFFTTFVRTHDSSNGVKQKVPQTNISRIQIEVQSFESKQTDAYQDVERPATRPSVFEYNGTEEQLNIPVSGSSFKSDNSEIILPAESPSSPFGFVNSVDSPSLLEEISILSDQNSFSSAISISLVDTQFLTRDTTKA